MKALPLTDEAKKAYEGCGWALVAVSLGAVTKFNYLVNPGIENEHVLESFHEAAIMEGNHAAKIKELANIGQVWFGMLSCYEFVPYMQCAR